MDNSSLALLLITFVAAIVNGALGYGFSSITVPIALLFLSNRVLNPALVLVEIVLNAWVLWTNRAAVPHVWRRVLPVMVGLLPGVIVGALILSLVSPAWVKLATYIVLLPLIIVQAAGWRRPIKAEKSVGLVFGSGLGVLYSVTTISGPPLAVALNNQGFSKQQFRAALGCIRLAESGMTGIAYLWLGLFTTESLALVPSILPSVLIGVPIGVIIIRHVRSETFRRVCMSFDAWIVAFGISTLLRELRIVAGYYAYLVLVAVVVIDICLLYRFFSQPRSDDPPPPLSR
jgi:uncharacterized membrane protein YfcA